MRIVNSLLALLFFVFAVLQYNDPDPWSWITLYTGVALLCTAAAFDHGPQKPILLLAAVIMIWMATLLPDLLIWLREGMPTIIGSMQASDPHIETVREFLGLGLALLTVAHLLFRAKARV